MVAVGPNSRGSAFETPRSVARQARPRHRGCRGDRRWQGGDRQRMPLRPGDGFGAHSCFLAGRDSSSLASRLFPRPDERQLATSANSGRSSTRTPRGATHRRSHRRYSSNISSIRRSARRRALGSAPDRRSASAASSSTATGSATLCSGSAASRCIPLRSTAFPAPSTNLSARGSVTGASSSACSLEVPHRQRPVRRGRDLPRAHDLTSGATTRRRARHRYDRRADDPWLQLTIEVAPGFTTTLAWCGPSSPPVTVTRRGSM